MTTTKKPKGDPLVAAETIFIEGKAFERGERVTGVSRDELDRAVSQRRVILKSTFEALAELAPAIGGNEPDADGADSGDAGDTEGAGA